MNNCVGERNYRYFIGFLFIHAFTLIYGATAILCILKTEVDKQGLMHATFVHKVTGARVQAGWGVIFQYLMFHFGSLMGLLIMCTMMGVVLLGFWGYHMDLIRKNTTTNESFKWGSVSYEYNRIVKSWSRFMGEKKKAIAEAKKQGGDGSNMSLQGLGLHMSKDDKTDLTRVPTAKPVMPNNRYNHGFWANFKEVMFPRSLRPAGAPDRVAVLQPPVTELTGEPFVQAGTRAAPKQKAKKAAASGGARKRAGKGKGK